MDDVPEMGEDALSALLGNESNVDRRIVASLGRFSEFALKLADQRNVQLWDRHRLEDEVGRMALAELDVREGAVGESVLETVLEDGPGERRGAFPGEAGPSGGDARGVSATADGSAVIEFSDPEVMVRPRISQERAKHLVQDRIEGAFRFDLQMMPHFCYVYTCEVEGVPGSREKRVGAVLVNAVTGEAREWPQREPVVKFDIKEPRMEPALDKVAAQAQAREKALSLNTRVLHLKQEKGPVTVYEKRTVRPAEDALVLEFKGMVYLPVWGVEGGNGALVLDAVTGHVVKEELFRHGGEMN